MICPRCLNDTGTSVNNTHFVCTTQTCLDENQKRTQFKYINDDHLYFPYNVIFPNRSVKEFYRKPYLLVKKK